MTYLGITQCGNLRQHLQALPLARQVELVVVSPMRRTIQTALFALSWLIQDGTPILARTEWQENSDKPCDTGSTVEELAQEFPNVDFSQLDAIYPSKTGLYAFNRESIVRRGVAARRWLRQRPEKVVCPLLSLVVFSESNAY